MAPFCVKPAAIVSGIISVSSDKAITHRAIILSSISQGRTTINNFSSSLDCFYTLKIFKQLGVKISAFGPQKNIHEVCIEGSGLFGLRPSNKPLYVGESGTTIRMLLGLLAGQNFESELIAAPSLNKRPMGRVIKPLELMGAKIKAKVKNKNAKQEQYPPLIVEPEKLHGIKYKLEIPSAQVKTAILLAGLYANGKTQVVEPKICRDHTERMLKLFGADINVTQNNLIRKISINSDKPLISPKKIYIPGDISSAIFFVAAGLILPNSSLTLKGIGLNPTRIGALEVLKRMKANIKIKNYKILSGEPIGDIEVYSLGAHHDVPLLSATTIKRSELPLLIDELPILMVLASQANGTTIIEKAKELRVKETDRINSMVVNLSKMGADIDVKTDDTIIIKGPVKLSGAKLKSFGDHRTAMSLVVAGLTANSPSIIDDISCTQKSFPEFKKLLKKILRNKDDCAKLNF